MKTVTFLSLNKTTAFQKTKVCCVSPLSSSHYQYSKHVLLKNAWESRCFGDLFFLEGRRRQETSQLSTTSSAPFLKVLFVFVTKQLGNENIYPHKSLYMHILSSIHKTKEKLKSSSTDTCSNMNEP